SLIYVNRSLRARQVDVPSSNVTAVEFQIGHRSFLAFLIYVPLIISVCSRNIDLDYILRQVEQTQTRFPTHELIIRGDFNRHDQL
ncbi:hypothetical protein K469DRAFT_546755, partial [Zopfia rhizophila CBS 207.26]